MHKAGIGIYVLACSVTEQINILNILPCNTYSMNVPIALVQDNCTMESDLFLRIEEYELYDKRDGYSHARALLSMSWSTP